MTAAYVGIESNVRYYAHQFPAIFSKAAGSYMFDTNGRKYLDFLSGAGSLNYGHNNEYILDAVLSYLKGGNIVHSLDLMTEAKHQFLETLDTLILRPRALSYKCQFTGPTGANAVEAALKLARKLTGRTNIIAFTRSYHGVSLGALAVTASPEKRRVAGTPLSAATFMPYDGFLGSEIDTSIIIDRMLSDVGSGIDKPAAILLETIQGEGGLNVASSDWLSAIARLAKHLEIPLIIDDIQAGCGRSTDFFSFEQAGIIPDIVVLSKSLSGFGTPFSLVLIRDDMDVWNPGEHNGTFRGNNLAFVGGASALSRYWLDQNFISEVKQKAVSFQLRLDLLFQKYAGVVVGARGRGMMLGCEFVQPKMAAEASRMMFESGIVVETCGPLDNVLKFLPPLTISDSDLGLFAETLDNILRVIENHS